MAGGPIEIEFRGGPRNSEREVYASLADVPDGIEYEYLDSNIGDPNGPKTRTGRYVLDRAYNVLGWTIDHAPGIAGGRYVDESKNPQDVGELDQIRPRTTSKR